MKKVINYIANGQGLGIRFLLILSAILAIIISVQIKAVGTIGVPYLQDIAERVLPIRIENGIVVEPYDTIKIINVFEDLEIDGEDDLFMVINTTVDSLNASELSYGIYLTRRAIYVVTPRETKIHQLVGDIYIENRDYTQTFNKFINWVAITIFPFSLAFVFLAYFILTIFYATCAIAVCSIMKKKFDFDFRMRMSTVAFITTYIIFVPLGWIGVTSNWLFFFAVLALQALIIRDMEPQKTHKKNINKI